MRTGPGSENLPPPVCPACWANTCGAAAIAVAATPLASTLRLLGSIIGFLLSFFLAAIVIAAAPLRLRAAASAADRSETAGGLWVIDPQRYLFPRAGAPLHAPHA